MPLLKVSDPKNKFIALDMAEKGAAETINASIAGSINTKGINERV
jgi:hypothetical protein